MTPILWRAINEHGEVLDVLLREHRDTSAAKRFFKRLTDDQELPELDVADHIIVSATERQNNRVEQLHRPIRD